MAAVLIGLSIGLGGAAPAAAQIGDAARALDAAIRSAQRAVTPRKRKRKRSRKQEPAAAQTAVLPPPPDANPRRANKFRQTANNAVKFRQTRSEAVKTVDPAAAKTSAADDAANSKDEAGKETPPEPEVWTAAEIEAAGKACKKILSQVRAKFEPVEPMRKGPCGAAAPYRLASLGDGDKVTFSPAPVLNCKMIAALDRWLRRGLQPLAKEHLGSPIKRVSVMSSYSCRNAYGRTTTKLSEHALANAIDIGGFVTEDGQRTMLLAHWGPTQRDLLAQKRKEEEERKLAALQKAKAESGDGKAKVNVKATQAGNVAAVDKTATGSGTIDAGRSTTTMVKPLRSEATALAPATQLSKLPPLPDRRPSLRERLEWAKAARQQPPAAPKSDADRKRYRSELQQFLYQRNNLGGPKPPKTQKQVQTKPAKPKIDRAAFLRDAHRTACRIFGTVLGPEANEAHRDHFHVDLAHRRRRNYCR